MFLALSMLLSSAGAAEYHGPKSRFQLSSTYPGLCQHYSEHHPVASTSQPIFFHNQETSLLSISRSLSKTNLSTDLFDYPLLILVSIYTTYLSPPHLIQDHPACLLSGLTT